MPELASSYISTNLCTDTREGLTRIGAQLHVGYDSMKRKIESRGNSISLWMQNGSVRKYRLWNFKIVTCTSWLLKPSAIGLCVEQLIQNLACMKLFCLQWCQKLFHVLISPCILCTIDYNLVGCRVSVAVWPTWVSQHICRIPVPDRG